MKEISSWRAYYELFPFDDLHRYHRPAALVSAAMGGSFEKGLQILQPDPIACSFDDSDLRSLAAFGLKPPNGFH